METVIVGGGGHGRDIAATLDPYSGARFAGFYDDNPSRATLGDLADWLMDDRPHLIGINDPRVRCDVDKLRPSLGCVWVHPAADVGPGVAFGRHAHVNAGCTLTRCTVGEFTTLSPGVTVCGDVTIGSLVTVGAGAVVCNFVTIGDGATIGAGAVIPPHTVVPPGETWAGVPARRLS